MALEQRQTQIEVGAGQTESQLNRDFVDLLKKWSSPALFVIAAVVLGLWGLKQYRQSQDNKIAAAFVDLDTQTRLNRGASPGQTTAGANPKVALQVAQDHAGKGSIEWVARLTAADAWLAGAIRGTQPGAEFEPATGNVKDPKDLLSEADKKDFLEQAAAQYKAVADGTAGKPGLAVLQLRARFGQAAVEETRGQFDAAIAAYQAAEKTATEAAYPAIAKLAKDRAADALQLKDVASLPAEADVATINRTPVPAPAPMPNIPGLPPGVKLEPVDGPPPGMTPPAAPATPPASPAPSAPAPSPAPTTNPGSPAPAPAPKP